MGGADIIKDSRQSLHNGLKDLHRRVSCVLVKVNGSEPPAIIVLTCLKETL